MKRVMTMKGKHNFKSIIKMKNFPNIMILLVMMVLTFTLSDNLLTAGGIRSQANAFVPLILLTIGQTAMLIAGTVDLSNGAALSLMTCILAQYMDKEDPVTSIYAIGLAFLAAIAAGLLNGFAVGVMRIPSVIATFATSYIFMGAGLLILPKPGGECVNWVLGFYNFSLVENAPGWLETLGNAIPPAVWLLLLVVIVWEIVIHTKFGRYLYASGSNEESAYVSGINTGKVRIQACLLNAFCIFLTGLFFVAQNQSGDYQLGDAFTLKSIASAVIGGVSMAGGRGGLANAVIGALIYSFVSKIIFFANFPTAYQTLVSGLIVIFALLFSYVYDAVNERSVGKER